MLQVSQSIILIIILNITLTISQNYYYDPPDGGYYYYDDDPHESSYDAYLRERDEARNSNKYFDKDERDRNAAATNAVTNPFSNPNSGASGFNPPNMQNHIPNHNAFQNNNIQIRQPMNSFDFQNNIPNANPNGNTNTNTNTNTNNGNNYEYAFGKPNERHLYESCDLKGNLDIVFVVDRTELSGFECEFQSDFIKEFLFRIVNDNINNNYARVGVVTYDTCSITTHIELDQSHKARDIIEVIDFCEESNIGGISIITEQGTCDKCLEGFSYGMDLFRKSYRRDRKQIIILIGNSVCDDGLCIDWSQQLKINPQRPMIISINIGDIIYNQNDCVYDKVFNYGNVGIYDDNIIFNDLIIDVCSKEIYLKKADPFGRATEDDVIPAQNNGGININTLHDRRNNENERRTEADKFGGENEDEYYHDNNDNNIQENSNNNIDGFSNNAGFNGDHAGFGPPSGGNVGFSGGPPNGFAGDNTGFAGGPPNGFGNNNNDNNRDESTKNNMFSNIHGDNNHNPNDNSNRFGGRFSRFNQESDSSEFGFFGGNNRQGFSVNNKRNSNINTGRDTNINGDTNGNNGNTNINTNNARASRFKALGIPSFVKFDRNSDNAVGGTDGNAGGEVSIDSIDNTNHGFGGGLRVQPRSETPGLRVEQRREGAGYRGELYGESDNVYINGKSKESESVDISNFNNRNNPFFDRIKDSNEDEDTGFQRGTGFMSREPIEHKSLREQERETELEQQRLKKEDEERKQKYIQERNKNTLSPQEKQRKIEDEKKRRFEGGEHEDSDQEDETPVLPNNNRIYVNERDTGETDHGRPDPKAPVKNRETNRYENNYTQKTRDENDVQNRQETRTDKQVHRIIEGE